MTTTDAQDKALGLKIVKKFYEGARYHYPFAVMYSFDEMLKTLESRPAGKTFLAGLGLAAYLAEFSEDDIKSSMYALAKAAGGQVPARNGDFYNYMVDQGTKVNYVSALTYTASETAKTVVNGVAEVGNTLISTGKILNFLFPIAVLYFGWIYLNNKVKA